MFICKKGHEHNNKEFGKARCVACRLENQRKRAETGGKEFKEVRRLAAIERRKNTNCVKEQFLRKYWPGSTGKEALIKYNELMVKQNYCCVMCGSHNDNFSRDLCVDHCHKTGQVRGLLCGPCNIALGHYEKIKVSAEMYLTTQNKGNK